MLRIPLHHPCLPIALLLCSTATASSQPAAGPSKVLFSTYLGGTGVDEGLAVATDASGAVYVAGLTSSTVFPGTHSGLIGVDDAFVAKFSPAGQLLYSTRLGGSGFTEAMGIAVDDLGNLYITGQTSATDLPIVNGYQSLYGGGFSDAFLAKFDQSGALIYSTFLGGSSSGNEFGHAIAVDQSGNAYIAGTTSAPDFPLRNAFQGTYGGGFSDAFIARINTNVAGDAGLIYSTYLGSFGFDSGNAIAVDGSGHAVIAGAAACCFPTTPDAVQTFLASSAFTTKMGPTGQLIYSTVIGGSGHSVALAVAIDQNDLVYVGGETSSPDFPTTPQAFQVEMHGSLAGFVVLIDPSVSGPAGMRYSSLLAGSASDSVRAAAVDGVGRVSLTGITESPDFPTKDAVQPVLGGQRDAFFMQIDPSLAGTTGLIYGTFLGGLRDDQAAGVALSPDSRIAITGITDGPFPTDNAFQPNPAGSLEAFVTYVSFDMTPPVLTLSDLIINATGASGAIGTFVITASDLDDPNPIVQCTPPSGSAFAIGTTQVRCSASDASDNSATGEFQVHVKGAQEQIGDLKVFVGSLGLDKGLTNSLQTKLNAAEHDPRPGACSDLNDFIKQVAAKTGTSIAAPVANQLTTSAGRIRAVLGCPR